MKKHEGWKLLIGLTYLATLFFGNWLVHDITDVGEKINVLSTTLIIAMFYINWKGDSR